MKPKVTIVIPIYNGSNFMSQAIDSALAQTYKNLEVIVVNDGSTDQTEAIALSYGEKIRYFYKNNGGVASALNLGIEMMKGEYFSYLPHDDLLHPEKIESEIEAIRGSGNELTIAWSGWNYLEEPKGEILPFSIPPWYSWVYLTKRTYPLFFGIVNTVTVLINKKLFDMCGTFDQSLFTSQDYDMWFRTFKVVDTVYIDRPLVDYRIHPAQGTQYDPGFIKNCQDLALKALKTTDSSLIEHMCLSEYVFYYMLIKYYREVGWDDCYFYALSRFSNASEMENADRQRRKLNGDLHQDGRKLILYGAGKNGRRLLNELRLFGITVEAFCDYDTQKTGMKIDGLPCISKDQLLDSHSTVILTFDNPIAVRQELEGRGFVHVMDYAEITHRLNQTCPIKDKVLQQMREGKDGIFRYLERNMDSKG